MRTVKLVLVLSFGILIGLTSCQKTDDISVSVAGIYKGTLTKSLSPDAKIVGTENYLKGDSTKSDSTTDATMEVTDLGDGTLELHCYSEDFDTTFLMNEYLNGDSVMLCATGQAFEEMYGHRMGDSTNNWQDNDHDNSQNGNGMMGNGMSGSGMMGNWTEHLNNDHQQGDEHYGGFNMNNGTMSYTMLNSNYSYTFTGKRK